MLRNIIQKVGSRRSLLQMKARSLSSVPPAVFAPTDTFMPRHMGSQGADRQAMLDYIGFKTMDELTASTVPDQIKLDKPLDLEPAQSESEAIYNLKNMLSKNIVNKSFIGAGYYETLTPPVILRNVLENPGWYTSYTPYQAEISQGRLQGLLNFQTMVCDLTGMSMSNASLLDEATAAAEAMSMAYNLAGQKKKKIFVDENCHPQNIALIKTRSLPLGIHVEVGDISTAQAAFDSNEYFGAVAQYPDTKGAVKDWSAFNHSARSAGVLTIACTDLMASVLLKPAGEQGFDIAVGVSQRFGVPMGFGGPHAAFLATSMEYSRKMPGRIIGVTIDSQGNPSLRMAMQTREQHIRRDKATSNICTAQALLANMAGFYGAYHGPEGLKKIATRIHDMTRVTAKAVSDAGFTVENADGFFDTITVSVPSAQAIQDKAAAAGVNVRVIDDKTVGISFGESIMFRDVVALTSAFGVSEIALTAIAENMDALPSAVPSALARETAFMEHPVFNSYHSEAQMTRYLKELENKDMSLVHSMISLGSCTMKLNATTEMMPVTWPEVANIHPFAPVDQTHGYIDMIEDLNNDLAKITGFAAASTQPNSGAQGEYAGLLCIREYHIANGDDNRNICLIPVSAHGTNPASASMCGMKVVVVKSDDMGNIDLEDLKAKADKHADNLGALMITYPSTYGVFEEEVKTIIDYVHDKGGQVYMDGANMNAQVALTSPGHIGADVCHLNLHKTFCIPHGGGGPGVGTIGVAKHLAPYLPGHNVLPVSGEGVNVAVKSTGAVAAAPYGSAAILPISYLYIKMLGEEGLKEATGMAILNANYMAKKLEQGYDVLYRGSKGQCAHEFILDLRSFKPYGIVEEDIAKRLQDYGFHSPTMSWPVGGTIMVEPTESEDKAEMDRFCEAMLGIRREIEDIVQGKMTAEESPLKKAPHTQAMVFDDEFYTKYKYTREVAAYPAPWVRGNKFWPTTGRVDNVYGDRNLVCSCPPVESYITVDA